MRLGSLTGHLGALYRVKEEQKRPIKQIFSSLQSKVSSAVHGKEVLYYWWLGLSLEVILDEPGRLYGLLGGSKTGSKRAKMDFIAVFSIL